MIAGVCCHVLVQRGLALDELFNRSLETFELTFGALSLLVCSPYPRSWG